jgi:hypothetical protein
MNLAVRYLVTMGECILRLALKFSLCDIQIEEKRRGLSVSVMLEYHRLTSVVGGIVRPAAGARSPISSGAIGVSRGAMHRWPSYINKCERVTLSNVYLESSYRNMLLT